MWPCDSEIIELPNQSMITVYGNVGETLMGKTLLGFNINPQCNKSIMKLNCTNRFNPKSNLLPSIEIIVVTPRNINQVEPFEFFTRTDSFMTPSTALKLYSAT
jgi:hypothetical protein